MPSLKQLQYFCALAKNGNMSKLADEFFVSQTALSNSIARLESELGVRLFDRQGRNIVLNEYGRKYLQYVEPGLNSILLGSQTLELMSHKPEPSVSLATSSSTLWSMMIGSFLNRYPQYSISQQECQISNINHALPNLDIDLIIAGSIDFDSPYLDSICFLKDPVRLYVPLDHPFAGRKSIRLIEAKNEKYIYQPRTSGFSRFSDMLFEQAGFEPTIVAECDYTLRRDLLKSGVGVVLASDSVLRANFYENCTSVLIEDEYAIREMSCFWLKDRPLSVAAKTFKTFLLEYYQ